MARISSNIGSNISVGKDGKLNPMQQNVVKTLATDLSSVNIDDPLIQGLKQSDGALFKINNKFYQVKSGQPVELLGQ